MSEWRSEDDERNTPTDETRTEDETAATPTAGQKRVLEADTDCVSVDAGAGTGKTTTMRWRIETLLTATDGPLSDRVLVVTFANEAAASIQQSITKAEQLSVEQAFNVEVYTYHSFCSQLVSEYAYTLGIDPEFDVITADQQFRTIQQLINDNDYQYVSQRQDDRAAVETQAVEYIRQMRQEAVSPAMVDAFVPHPETIDELKRLVIDLEQSATELFDPDRFTAEEFAAGETAITESLEAYRERLSRWKLVAKHRSGDTWEAVESYLEYLTLWTKQIAALIEEDPVMAYNFLPQGLFEPTTNAYTYWWTDLKQTPMGHLRAYVDMLDEVSDLQAIYRDYVAELEARGVLDFDELINKANTLINDSPVGEEIRERWDYVFCDEFQDTDELQLEVVTGLARGETQLLAIGDLDQAIYGWRGANPEGLDSLEAAFGDHERIDINENFRSDQEILEIANQCGAYESKQLRSEDCQETADGEPYVERTAADEARVGMVCGDWTELTPAQEVATTISQLLEDGFESINKRSLGDIAVIVRTNRQARDVAARLRDRQIPYQIEGANETKLEAGIQTILSYFRVLADSTADIHLRRVLLLVYRVTDRDLNALETAQTDSLYEAVMTHDETDEIEVAHPQRVRRARTNLQELQALTETSSLPQFYEAFRNKTRIQWYVQKESRTQLDRITTFLQAYDSDNVLRRFSAAFVDSLSRSLTDHDQDVAAGVGSQSADKIDIMTVHQAKGLQFDTVLFPYLEDDEWVSTHAPGWASAEAASWSAHHYQSLIRTITDDEFSHPLAESAYEKQQAEQWRTFHVGVTRAESLLILFSQSSKTHERWQKPLSYLRKQCLRAAGPANAPEQLLEAAFPAANTPWSPEQPQMKLCKQLRETFKTVQTRYPETVVNLSEEVSQAANVLPGTITYFNKYEDELNVKQAIEEIHRLGQDIFDEQLTPQDPNTVDIYSSSLSFDDDLELPVQHSHSSLETYTDCPRRHLLDHVLYGFDDPVPTDVISGQTDEPSWRTVGRVFHAVAEEAFYRSERDKPEWLSICDRIIRARDLESVRTAVETCIHRLFETDLNQWEPVAAELPFELTAIDGVDGPVVGYMDSVRRIPAKGLAVLDYKTTFETRELSRSTQLLLYLKACEELFDEPVEWAGYVYVGEAGGETGTIDLIHRERIDGNWSDVVRLLQEADSPSWEPTPGSHCQHCPHRSLGCGPAEYAYDSAYLLNDSD